MQLALRRLQTALFWMDLNKYQKLGCYVRLNTLNVGDGTDTMYRNAFSTIH